MRCALLLRARRHLRPNQDDTFSMLSSDSLVSAWDQLTGAIAATAVGVVSVFMVVGGVVIMNIMLAVVTERTHEIGIRKSVGARRQDILNQFLVESSMLAGIGGCIGVVLAWLIALLVRNAHARSHGDSHLGRRNRSDALGSRGPILRHLSGATGCEARSHRSVAGGTMTWVELSSGNRLGSSTVREHKMRSFLTVLGVIIGTGTIIGVGSIIAGLDGAITAVMRSMGSNTAIVFRFPIGFNNISRDDCKRKPLTYEEAPAIAERCPSVRRQPVPVSEQFRLWCTADQLARYKGNELYQPDIGGTEDSYARAARPKCRKAASSPISRTSITCRWS